MKDPHKHIDMDLKGKGIVLEIEEHRVGFSLAFILIFTGSFLFLAVLNVLPDPTAQWNEEHGGTPVPEYSQPSSVASTTSSAQGNTATTSVAAFYEQPVRIVIDSISLDVAVSNPTSTNVGVLDSWLLKGAVRYPTSALLGQFGTVLLFGHSSYLTIPGDQPYKTFDGIQNLRTGDEISVYSSTKEYRYRVTGVRQANVNDQNTSTIELPSNGQFLTLITCDSFATKSDRFVVTAQFVGTYSLAS
ncbi:MAG: sortase [Patescibacteria group bacterium]|nr:sortase [Patescibacteria group bacterium]